MRPASDGPSDLRENAMKLQDQADKGKIRDKQKRQMCHREREISIDIKKNEERHQWAMETWGSYILRTNWTETNPKVLWNTHTSSPRLKMPSVPQNMILA
ncbi:MAG: hypothetical protein A4E65_00987 [Syntrophorhabdus sp. PtaU1.Bin153]|nr:MAG: hypothetical protein A4E65_00987 [Syntrophorhabdus sp. PtaU1.Bin153]